MCTWTFTATSLVKGLGSNADLLVHASARGVTRTAIYHDIEGVSALQFKPVTVDGIPGVHGFGAQTEVVVDVGPVTMTAAALSTISAAVDGPAALTIASDAVAKLCRSVRCSP